MQKIEKLNNKIDLITIPTKGTKTATILVMVGTGSRYEAEKIAGISHFLEHMVFKGTKKRPTALAISGELDSMGAEYNAFTGKEYTGFWIKSDSALLPRAIEVLSDMLLGSKLASDEIEREKGVIIEELNMYLDNPMYHIEDVFENLLYGNTAAGRDTIGTRESVSGVRRGDFIDYLGSQYRPENITICVAGNISGSKSGIAGSVAEHFDFKKAVKAGEFKEKARVKEGQKQPAVKVQYKKTDQAHISLGVRTFGYAHEDRLLSKLLAIILGGSMSSRLFISLRERNGLAYYVRTSSESYSDSGYLTTQAGVPVDKIEQAVKIILGEYRMIKEKAVGERELRRIKDMLKGRVAIQMESSDNVANWYAQQAVMISTLERTGESQGLKVIPPEEYLKKIESVTAAELRRVARNIFVPKNLNLAVIGPYKDATRIEKQVVL